MATKTIHVLNMACGACRTVIKSAIESNGMLVKEIDMDHFLLKVDLKDKPLFEVYQCIEELGYVVDKDFDDSTSTFHFKNDVSIFDQSILLEELELLGLDVLELNEYRLVLNGIQPMNKLNDVFNNLGIEIH